MPAAAGSAEEPEGETSSEAEHDAEDSSENEIGDDAEDESDAEADVGAEEEAGEEAEEAEEAVEARYAVAAGAAESDPGYAQLENAEDGEDSETLVTALPLTEPGYDLTEGRFEAL